MSSVRRTILRSIRRDARKGRLKARIDAAIVRQAKRARKREAGLALRMAWAKTKALAKGMPAWERELLYGTGEGTPRGIFNG